MPATRRRMRLLIAIGVTLFVAAPIAQSPDARSDRATRESLLMLEQWLGPPPSPQSAPAVSSAFPESPATMDVESTAALAAARRWWPQPTTTLSEGAAIYLQSRVIARLFDLSFGRAGSAADAIHLFGGTYTIAFPQLRFDAPHAGLGRDRLTQPAVRAANAFASLERLIGQPRLVGALRTVVERKPSSDADVIRELSESLGQDIAWLFEAIDPSTSMNYAIGTVTIASCEPAPCERVTVDATHAGAGSFHPIEVRVDFADGQSASATWDGKGESRRFLFEGPARPVRVRLDPDVVNLLDGSLLDQHREIDARTNAPIAKWIARWMVWLQGTMLAYSGIV
jgi:hypothetical protein